MTSIFYTDAVLNNTIELFNKGFGLTEAAKAIGCNADNLSKFVRSRGVVIPKIKRSSARRKDLPDQEIIELYNSGISELELSKMFNVARTAIRTRLIESGCEIRSHSEANIVSMARATFEKRKERAKAAHDSLRGVKRSHDELIKRSFVRFGSTSTCHIGAGERELYQYFCSLGIDAIWQKPADIYNIDIAIGNIAVELKSGCSNIGPAKNSEARTKKIIELGYSVLYLCFVDIESLFATIDDIVAHLDILRLNPSSLGEYWVITCRSQDYAIIHNDFGQFTRIDAPKKFVTTIRKINY